MNNKVIPPYDYLKGGEFTKRLKLLTECDDFQELSELLDVPKTTFSTWNTHNRTSHELMVRLHLALGIPIEELALKPEDRKSSGILSRMQQQDKTEEPSRSYAVQPPNQSNPQHETVILQSFTLSNGKLIPTGEIPYPYRRLNSYGLLHTEVIEIETNDATYLVDKGTKDALSGKYLIDIDGMLSINQIQRLPGKKLAIAFGDTTMEVAEEDIKVTGRVAATLKKD